MTLLDPLNLGGVTAHNRVLFGPHVTNLGAGRALSDRHVAYYRRRAAGGAGTVVIETASVHDGDWPYERAPLARHCPDGWAEIARTCHAEGALAFASLGHAGGQGSSAYSQSALWAPSHVPDPATREVPKAMEAEDIAAVVAGFGEAARLAVAAGLDGVEVNAGQHSLVRQFMSGLTNQRRDGYGVDRLRFAREVLAAVRRAGPRAVGLRMSCDELAPWAGITPETAVELLTGLACEVDYVVVVRGSIYSVAATRPDGHVAPGFNLDLARRVREALRDAGQDAGRDAGSSRVAVVAQGSIVEADMAGRAVTSGAADAVEMTRAQIADPDLVAKLRSGAPDRVRPCVLCNQTCRVRDPRNPVVSCIGEPSAGHETEDAPVAGRDERAWRVLVVGAGVAGLEAARVAGLRGHQVRVVEQRERTGGALRGAAAGPGRERLALLADWLDAECRRAGVEIACSTAVAAPDVAAHDGPVLLCTGSTDGRLDYQVEEGADVRTARSVLELAAAGPPTVWCAQLPEGPAVVHDPVGGPVAVSVAELLVAHREVTLVSRDLVIGARLGLSGDLVPVNARLLRAGVRLEKRTILRGVRPGRVAVEDVYTGATREIAAAFVVEAGHLLPDDALWRAHPRRVRAGDAVAPRSAYEAVLEGRRAALALGDAGRPG
ncbi:MAG: mycofactocin system FadH/OYE family oxidoreductase 1 [Carbonactinosporaceae bacterium]